MRYGQLIIDSVRITLWYAKISGCCASGGVVVLKFEASRYVLNITETIFVARYVLSAFEWS
jgi:hypothetical protein